MEKAKNSARRALLVLHPAFALTGILQAVNGPLMPALAATFHWSDSRSGLLFLVYFTASSTAPLLCRFNYAWTMAMGFAAMALGCMGAVLAGPLLLFPVFLLLGLSNGVAASSINLLVGRNYRANCAPTLTLLNFSWSAGALAGPLLAAPLLLHHSYRAVYLLVGLCALLAVLACRAFVEEGPEPLPLRHSETGLSHARLIALFATIAFLEVGVENTALAWLSTYLLRTAGGGLALAAAMSSLYWAGFLSSRALSSLLLWQVEAMRVFWTALSTAFAAALLLIIFPSGGSREAAIFFLGAALGPIYPLLLSALFGRVRRTADTRWMLAIGGLGGSLLPALTGWISASSGSLRLGLMTIPAAILAMAALFCLLPPKPKTA
jgi:fucose permease